MAAMMTQDEINQAVADLRCWLYDESGVKNSFDAIRVLAISLGDFAADAEAALDYAQFGSDDPEEQT